MNAPLATAPQLTTQHTKPSRPVGIIRNMRVSKALPVALLLLSGCGSSNRAGDVTATGPSGATDAVNMAGSWRGTLVAPGFVTRTLVLTVVQGGSCVDGGWRTEPAEWIGAISGYADRTSFNGAMTLASADGTGRCTGTASVSGPVDQSSIRWTTTAFTGSCPEGLPQTVTIEFTKD